MIAKKENIEASAEAALPNSRKVYVAGKVHVDLRVPFREISLAPTKMMSGEIEVNEPVRVYDTSGPWGDPNVDVDVTRGLPPLRAEWIRDRGDVEEIEGRAVRPQDDGYLSEKHAAESASKRRTPNPRSRGTGSAVASAERPISNSNGNGSGNLKSEIFNLKSRRPLRAKPGRVVTQLWYARQGIITPEMEFIAIRERGM